MAKGKFCAECGKTMKAGQCENEECSGRKKKREDEEAEETLDHSTSEAEESEGEESEADEAEEAEESQESEKGAKQKVMLALRSKCDEAHDPETISTLMDAMKAYLDEEIAEAGEGGEEEPTEGEDDIETTATGHCKTCGAPTAGGQYGRGEKAPAKGKKESAVSTTTTLREEEVNDAMQIKEFEALQKENETLKTKLTEAMAQLDPINIRTKATAKLKESKVPEDILSPTTLAAFAESQWDAVIELKCPASLRESMGAGERTITAASLLAGSPPADVDVTKVFRESYQPKSGGYVGSPEAEDPLADPVQAK